MATKEEGNKKFLVAEFDTNSTDGKMHTEVYLLNPGDFFADFGGSRSGLVVRKTASLIVRQSGPMGTHDVEHDVNNQTVWNQIFRVANLAGYKKEGSDVMNPPVWIATYWDEGDHRIITGYTSEQAAKDSCQRVHDEMMPRSKPKLTWKKCKTNANGEQILIAERANLIFTVHSRILNGIEDLTP